MGKGDKKTKKGKRWNGSYGKKRPSKKSIKKKLKRKNQKKDQFEKQAEKIKMLYSKVDTLKLLERTYQDKIKTNPNDKTSLLSIKNINIEKEKTLDLLNTLRNKFIGYSIEEIFVNNGQFDRFVSIEFYPDSRAYEKYGSSIMGTFIFTQFERKSLKRHIGQTTYPRTARNIKFEPSELCKLDENQIQELKTIGFNNRDINSIYQTSKLYENRYKKRPKYKEIPNTLEIKIKDDRYDYGPITLHILEQRIKENSLPLIPEEYHQYLALKLYYKKEELSEEERKLIYEQDGVTMLSHIQNSFLEIKLQKENNLSDEEKEVYNRNIETTVYIAKSAVDKEINKSSSDNLNSIINQYIKTYARALMLASQFKPENLSTYGAKYPIRIGLEAFLHITLRHCKGYQFGDWDGKRTTFEYSVKDLMRILKIIVKNCQNDIDKALDNGEEYQLVKGSSYLYDGNYYSIHIDKKGNLVSFHHRNK